MWLMQQGHKVTVAEPESVRNKLKKRYLAALKAIEENE
jgi:predicted DNA-binding transcriptional regulator YafY